MNEITLANDAKKMRNLIERALQKANALAALADGGRLREEKLQLTLEETAQYFEAAIYGYPSVARHYKYKKLRKGGCAVHGASAFSGLCRKDLKP